MLHRRGHGGIWSSAPILERGVISPRPALYPQIGEEVTSQGVLLLPPRSVRGGVLWYLSPLRWKVRTTAFKRIYRVFSLRPRLHSCLLIAPGTGPLTCCLTQPYREDMSIPSPMWRPRPWRSTYRRASSRGLPAPLRHQPSQAYFFVKKKDGELRPCNDYQTLNKATVKFNYPLPLITTIIEQIHGAECFTKLAYNPFITNGKLPFP